MTTHRDDDSMIHRRTFAFPVFAWRLDLEVQRDVDLTAAERTVLRLAAAGVGTTTGMAYSMGLGADQRLVATTATRLLELTGLAIEDGQLTTTPRGQAMLAAANLPERLHVSETVYYHALDRRWSWAAPDRPPRDVEWTIELSTPVAPPRERRDEIRGLVHNKGVPDLARRAVKGQCPPLELLGLMELGASVEHEAVELEIGLAADGGREIRGYRDGELDATLTGMVQGATVKKKARRLVLAPR